MGICSTNPQYRVVKAQTLFSKDKKYPRSAMYKVKKRNSSKKIIGFQEYFLEFPNPKSISSFKAIFDSHFFWVSSCTIPSYNPKISPKCKDRSLTIFHENVLLVAIFDGYGIAGDTSAEICVSKTSSYFYSNFQLIIKDPVGFLKSLYLHIDQILLSHDSPEVLSSGCTAIVSIISENNSVIAQLGDTRAIKAKLSNSKKFGKNSLVAEKLTEDHLPELPDEYSRITQTGARIEKLLDINGKITGPYRVWEENTNTLGLTISRCLGNPDSKSCGIIAEPSISVSGLNLVSDYFLVFGSSGLWATFDCQDLVNFVEAYRGHCLKGADLPTDEDEICYKNSCISQIVCEEARNNWIHSTDDGEIKVDDITCVVVEVKQTNNDVVVVNDVGLIAENLDERKSSEGKVATFKDSIKESRKVSMGISILNSKTDM